jgi:uncharacterized protein
MARRGYAGIVILAMQIIIRAYQLFVSPLLLPSCRFLPTCSEYAAEALGRHGILRGTILALRRLIRCHPWGSSGYDPVPETDTCGRVRAASGR